MSDAPITPPLPDSPSPATGLFIGRSVLDVIQLVDVPVPQDGKIRSTQHTIAAGGPATNAAVLFAALGGTSHLVSRVAADPLGQVLHGDLALHGAGRIHHHDVASHSTRPYAPYGTVPSAISITASNGDRSAVSGAPHPHANTGTLDPSLDHLLGPDVGVVLVDSDETDVSRSLTALARQRGVPTVLDVGAEKPVTTSQFPGIDSAIVAEDFRAESPDAIIDHLQSHGVPYGAVTRGAAPLRWFTPTERGWITPPTPGRVVDTLGAGDFFHGAYAYVIAQHGLDHASHLDALAWACHVSGLAVGHFGTRQWLQHLDDLPPLPSRA